MATNDQWDLRAGFTKDYDLATSAVEASDKQFRDAQKIIQNAYELDKTAATQGSDIERINQDNLEKVMASRERVGDFQSQQEIQRALESLGYADQPVSTEADKPPEQQKTQVFDDGGQLIEDPVAPINAVENTQKPTQVKPLARPMTQIEKLQAIEPMISSPKAKYALRQMVQKEAIGEAKMLATIAPDEAFNGLIKNGVIRGAPLVANDDGTYTRVMPDGKNQIRLDRNEAAAWVGDTINKTNEQYELIEARRKLKEGEASAINVDTARTKNRIEMYQELNRLNMTRDESLSQLKKINSAYDFDRRDQLARIQGRNKVRPGSSYQGAKSFDEDDNDEMDSAYPENVTPRAAQYDNAKPAFNSTIESAAKQNNLDPTIFKRLIGTESGFNPEAVNTVDGENVAFGVAQIYKSNIGDKPGQISMADAMNPEKALPYAAKLLGEYVKQSNGDYNEALMKYKGATSDSSRKAMQAPINDILSGMKKPTAGKSGGLDLSTMSLGELAALKLKEVEAAERAKKEGSPAKERNANSNIAALDSAIKVKGDDTGKGKKTPSINLPDKMNSLGKELMSKPRTSAQQMELSRAMLDLQKKYGQAQQSGDKLDAEKFEEEYRALMERMKK